ncbi:protein kinase [Cordyceps fumosorosea ARSEF 2679]|uniref:non-specific serine/threonine protein kinase n=1 Tax=Cordyceps fumosorosea (strain ARSEF 2679) TaxID=1081104 RepID=A0A168AP61_CORFA|nr:protein kinase [Cordyceps fumosorosea ARSEF 2679]OAA69005.1 protein kinase [Cordyceps fumosorosea ARSEF 2679]
MNNSDVIARLCAWPPHKILAAETIRRSPFAVSLPTSLPIASPFGRNNHLVTPIDPSSDSTSETLSNPHIQISFDTIPKTSHGIVFGCDRDSDVVLPDAAGVSAHHFSLSLDDRYRLVVRDLNSTAGTLVSFTGSGRPFSKTLRRRNFRWLVGGSNRMPSRDVMIYVAPGLSFRLELGVDLARNEYAHKVESFRRGSGASQALFQAVNRRLRRRFTNNGAASLSRDPIYREALLAVGGCGTATYVWDVSTGQEMVVKEPTNAYVPGNDEHRWKAEAESMQRLCHQNILKLLRAEFSPRPRLYLEYCSGGSLTDVADELEAADILQVLQQSLAGLQFAHAAGIVHRDLKLDNILVASRRPLQVKIADFGFAKEDGPLQSVCGTKAFMAPEIWEVHRLRPYATAYYTKAVDVWALGLVVYELLFGLPHGHGPDVCDRIVRHLQAHAAVHRGTMAQFLARHMLRPRGEDRSSAAACYRAAMALPANPSDRVEGVRGGACHRIHGLIVGGYAAAGEASGLSVLGSLTPALGSSTVLGPGQWAAGGAGKRTAGDTESPELDSKSRKRRVAGVQRRKNVPKGDGAETPTIRPFGCGDPVAALWSTSIESRLTTTKQAEDQAATQRK